MIANLVAAIRFRRAKYGATSAILCENTPFKHVRACHLAIGAVSYL